MSVLSWSDTLDSHFIKVNCRLRNGKKGWGDGRSEEEMGEIRNGRGKEDGTGERSVYRETGI